MYAATEKLPTAEAVAQALAYLEAIAVFDGPERQLAWRVAQHDGVIV